MFIIIQIRINLLFESNFHLFFKNNFSSDFNPFFKSEKPPKLTLKMMSFKTRHNNTINYFWSLPCGIFLALTLRISHGLNRVYMTLHTH